MSLLAVDLGGTKLAVAIFNEDGRILSRGEAMVDGKGGQEVGKLVCDNIQQLLRAEHAIDAVGISVPGISNQKNGTVWAPNIPNWDAYPLLEEVKNITGNRPVAIESDRSCYILGEMWQGNAKECTNAIFIAVGTGIGAGIVADGRVLHGAGDIAGAIGWMALQQPFKEEYISCGCFEINASGSGIAKTAKQLIMEDERYAGSLTGNFTAHQVFDAYERNDPVAVKVIRNAIQHWGMAIANLISIFNPEKILLGGGVFGPAVKFIPDITTEAMKWAQPISARQVSVEASSLGASAGLYGAGYLALQLNEKNK